MLLVLVGFSLSALISLNVIKIKNTDLYKDTEHIIGNLNSNVFSEKISPLRNWHTEIIQDYPCYTCKFLPVCGGSCPKNWLKNEPTCPTFKFNMGDRLILEYLKKKGKLLELIQS